MYGERVGEWKGTCPEKDIKKSALFQKASAGDRVVLRLAAILADIVEAAQEGRRHAIDTNIHLKSKAKTTPRALANAAYHFNAFVK